METESVTGDASERNPLGRAISTLSFFRVARIYLQQLQQQENTSEVHRQSEQRRELLIERQIEAERIVD